MNILSLNIKGIGVVGKENWVRKLKDENGVSVIALQETFCSSSGNLNPNRFWGRKKMEFDSVDALGVRP